MFDQDKENFEEDKEEFEEKNHQRTEFKILTRAITAGYAFNRVIQVIAANVSQFISLPQKTVSHWATYEANL